MTLHRRKLLCLTAGVVAMFAMPGVGLAEIIHRTRCG